MRVKYTQEVSGVFIVLIAISCGFIALGVGLIVCNGFTLNTISSSAKLSLIAVFIFVLAMWARKQSILFMKKREHLVQNGIKCTGRVVYMHVSSLGSRISRRRNANKAVSFHVSYYSQILRKEISFVTPEICRDFDVNFETAKDLVCVIYEMPAEESSNTDISFMFNTGTTDLNQNDDAAEVFCMIDAFDNAKPKPKTHDMVSKLSVVLWFVLAAAVIYFANKFA